MGHREKKKQHTRQQLTDAAFRLFVEQGYEQTTVEQIAESAMVSSRTFFRYFDTKDAVLAEPVLQTIQSLGEDLRTEGVRQVDQRILMRLLADRVAQEVADGHIGLQVRVVRENEELEKLGAAWRHRWARELSQELASLDDRAEATFEERMVATAAIFLLGCAIDEWIAGGTDATLQQLVDHVIATLWPGHA